MRWQRVQQPDDLLLGKPAYPSLRLRIEGNGWRFLDPLPRPGCPLQYGPQEGEVAIGGGAGTLRGLCLAPPDYGVLPRVGCTLTESVDAPEIGAHVIEPFPCFFAVRGATRPAY